MNSPVSGQDERNLGRSTAANNRIFILDEAEIREGSVEAYRDAVISGYKPGATARGMMLEAIWLSPPLILDGGGNSLYVLWSYPDLGAFWRARFADTDAKSEWWKQTASMTVSRKRSFLTDFAVAQ